MCKKTKKPATSGSSRDQKNYVSSFKCHLLKAAKERLILNIFKVKKKNGKIYKSVAIKGG